jgi:acetyl-CoA carboxylase carboxyltransferase component
VSFVDAAGFLPGLNQEEAGLAKAGAELLAAVARLRLPKTAVILGQAFGPAYVMLASKHLEADLTLAWPSARIGLMNRKGAVLSATQAKAQGLIDVVIEPRMTRMHLLEALSRVRDKSDS